MLVVELSEENEPNRLKNWVNVAELHGRPVNEEPPSGVKAPLKLAAGERGLELVGRLLGVAPVRRDLQDALIDLERLFAFSRALRGSSPCP